MAVLLSVTSDCVLAVSPVRMRMTSSTGVMKILPSPILPVAGGLGDDLDDLLDVVVGDDDLDLHLGHEVDDVRRAPVDLFLAAGAAEALDLGDGHAVNADLGERAL